MNKNNADELYDINEYTISDLVELFELPKGFNSSQLDSQFILFLEENKNVNEHIIFLKDAYYKLKGHIIYDEHDENSEYEQEDDIDNMVYSGNQDTGSNIINTNTKINNLLTTNSYSLFESSNDENNNIQSSTLIDNNRKQTIFNNHVVLPRNNQNGLNSYPINYKSSNLNQIERDIITRLVNIDAIFRKNTSSETNDFIYVFKDEIKNVISYKLASLELPNIWYTFSDTLRNNTFTIEVKDYSTGSTTLSGDLIYDTTIYDITIPEGNYNTTELTEVLNNILINLGGGARFILFEINVYTGKSIFRAKTDNDSEYSADPKPFEGDIISNPLYFSPNFAFDIFFDLPEFRSIRQQQKAIQLQYNGNIQDLSGQPDLFNIYNYNLRPIEYNCGYILGFAKELYSITGDNQVINMTKETTPITYKCYLESTGYYGNSINKYIFLKVDDYNNSRYNNFITDNINSINTDNILAKIQVNNGSFSMIYNNNSDFIKKERTFFGPVNIKKMRISLVDRFDRFIDIGESIFSLTLEVNQIYS
jgi:hypothetical protein